LYAIFINRSVSATADPHRGWDHGVFLPLKLAFPDAKIPVIAISVSSSLDPAFHLRVGELLAPLLDDGVLLLGSGSVTHGPASAPEAAAFTEWIRETLEDDAGLDGSGTTTTTTTTTSSSSSSRHRLERLAQWNALAPHARRAHRREEHLIPLHVVAGAARGRRAARIYHEMVLGGTLALDTFLFQDPPATAQAHAEL
jgi:aromatic ring-opening dioxygenase catalytic subunit (LigB family)